MAPDCIFIAYGSLAPGKENHGFIKHLKGVWKHGVVLGRLEHKGWGSRMGFPGFRKSNDPKSIEVQILFSLELPVYWDQLDEFEGDEYVRELIEFTLKDGDKGCGYLYALTR